MLFLGVQCIAFSYANLQENGCPTLDLKGCECYSVDQENNPTNNNLGITCDDNDFGDFSYFGLFRNLEESYTVPDEEDRQEKTSADDFESVLSLGSGKPKFNNLNISNTELTTLEFKTMDQVHFKTVHFSHNKFIRRVMKANALREGSTGKFDSRNLVPLKVINDFTERYIVEHSPRLGQGRVEVDLFDQISRLKALKYLMIANSGLRRVPEQAFAKPASKKIREIDLKENRIKKIGRRAFAGLPSLKILNLDRNDLTKLNDYAFTIDNSTSDTLLLFLRNNRLNDNSFTEKTFEGLKQRNLFIYLTGNNLTTLSESIFGPLLLRPLPYVTKISAFDNQFDCEDCSMKWIHDYKKRFFRIRVFGVYCQHNQKEIFSLPADFYKERCS